MRSLHRKFFFLRVFLSLTQTRCLLSGSCDCCRRWKDMRSREMSSNGCQYQSPHINSLFSFDSPPSWVLKQLVFQISSADQLMNFVKKKIKSSDLMAATGWQAAGFACINSLYCQKVFEFDLLEGKGDNDDERWLEILKRFCIFFARPTPTSSVQWEYFFLLDFFLLNF